MKMTFKDYKDRAIAHEQEGMNLRRELVYPLGPNANGDSVEVYCYLSLGAIAGGYNDPWNMYLRGTEGINNVGLHQLTPGQFRMLAQIRACFDAWAAGKRDDIPESGTTWSA